MEKKEKEEKKKKSKSKIRRILRSLLFDPIRGVPEISEEARPYVLTPRAELKTEGDVLLSKRARISVESKKKKNKVCKKLIVILDRDQRVLLKTNPSLKPLDIGGTFRYVKCNPPQIYCSKCSKANGLDEVKCQFCDEPINEEEVVPLVGKPP